MALIIKASYWECVRWALMILSSSCVWNKTSRSLLLVSGLLAFLSRKCFLRRSLADITCSMLLQMVLHLTMCSQLVGWIPHITLYPHLQYLCTNVIPWFLKILWEFYTLYVFIILHPTPNSFRILPYFPTLPTSCSRYVSGLVCVGQVLLGMGSY